MNYSTPGLPVHHQLPEFTQTHVHRVTDAIEPSHPLSIGNPSQHQSILKWVNSSHEVAKVLAIPSHKWGATDISVWPYFGIPNLMIAKPSSQDTKWNKQKGEASSGEKKSITNGSGFQKEGTTWNSIFFFLAIDRFRRVDSKRILILHLASASFPRIQCVGSKVSGV